MYAEHNNFSVVAIKQSRDFELTKYQLRHHPPNGVNGRPDDTHIRRPPVML